jgi:hypothetical protein
MKQILLQIDPDVLNGAVEETIKQMSEASPYSTVVYSLILLILFSVTGLFFFLYWQEKKYNKQRDEKVLEVVALMTTVKIKLDEERGDSKILEDLKREVLTNRENFVDIKNRLGVLQDTLNEISIISKINNK